MSNSSDDHQNDLIKQFCDISGLDPPRSKLYLSSAAWNLDLALSSFYEEADENEMDLSSPQEIEEPVPPAAQSKSDPKSEPTKPTGGNSNNSRIMTFSSLTKDDTNEDEGQTFYAGGSERSGQQVLGPGKKKADDIVSEMFKAAKEHGAEVLDPDAPSSSKAKSYVFKGTGYKLGQCENDSEVVPARASGGRSEKLSPREMVLRLWKDGFHVDDGPIRDYHDPANKEFLDSVVRGEIPRELVRELPGVEVSLSMEDHRTQAFQPAKKKLSAFAGEGHRLGNPSPDLVVQPASTHSSDDTAKCEGDAREALKVDETQPTTSIQVRLADGTKMVVKVNLSHTVGDIRRFISNAKPQFAAIVFILMTTFPNKELDDDMNIKDGNLMNAVIVQRLK